MCEIKTDNMKFKNRMELKKIILIEKGFGMGAWGEKKLFLSKYIK